MRPDRRLRAGARLLILTGARREEISKLRWDEIDGVNSANGATIVLAGDRTKTSEPRTIPLSTAAQAIIKTLPRVGDFVFKAGLPDWSRAKARIDEICHDPRVAHARSPPHDCDRPPEARRGAASHRGDPRPHQRISRWHHRRLSAPRLLRREARSARGLGRLRHGPGRGSRTGQGRGLRGEGDATRGRASRRRPEVRALLALHRRSVQAARRVTCEHRRDSVARSCGARRSSRPRKVRTSGHAKPAQSQFIAQVRGGVW